MAVAVVAEIEHGKQRPCLVDSFFIRSIACSHLISTERPDRAD